MTVRNDRGGHAYYGRRSVVKHDNDSLVTPEFVRTELEQMLPNLHGSAGDSLSGQIASHS